MMERVTHGLVLWLIFKGTHIQNITRHSTQLCTQRRMEMETLNNDEYIYVYIYIFIFV